MNHFDWLVFILKKLRIQFERLFKKLLDDVSITKLFSDKVKMHELLIYFFDFLNSIKFKLFFDFSFFFLNYEKQVLFIN